MRALLACHRVDQRKPANRELHHGTADTSQAREPIGRVACRRWRPQHGQASRNGGRDGGGLPPRMLRGLPAPSSLQQ